MTDGWVFVPCAVYSTNRETGTNWQWRHAIRKKIRKAATEAGTLALAAGTVSSYVDSVQIIVRPYEHHRTDRLLDVGNCATSSKCALDGLVDAGILVDDNPRYVKALTYVVGKRVSNPENEGLLVTFKPWGNDGA